MDTFEVTRLYADTNGHSHFERLLIPLHSAGSIGFVSEAEEVESIIFRKVLPEYDYDFHQAPAKQYIILLDGEIEIETSRGEKRNFMPGEIILVEDTTSKDIGQKICYLLSENLYLSL